MTFPISAVAVFCDDVREEKAGTETIVGVLPSNVNVPKFPGSFPRLSLYARIHLDPDINPEPLSIVLRAPNKEQLVEHILESETIQRARREAAEKGLPVAGVVIKIALGGYPVDRPGQFIAVLRIGEQEHVIGTLSVQANPEE